MDKGKWGVVSHPRMISVITERGCERIHFLQFYINQYCISADIIIRVIKRKERRKDYGETNDFNGIDHFFDDFATD